MTENDIIDTLKKSKIFQGLDGGEVEEICHFVMPKEREYDKNQIIINQGDRVSQVGFLKRGTAISTKYHFNGTAQILRIYNQGEVFSLDAVSTSFLTSPVTLISQSESSVVFIPYIKIFETANIRPEIKKVILSNCSEILSNELIRLTYKIDVLSKRTLRERILTYLSLIGEKNGAETFDIGMNTPVYA